MNPFRFISGTDGQTAPACLGVVAAVHGAPGHSLFCDDFINLAGLRTWAGSLDSCRQSESCGLTSSMLDGEGHVIGPCQWNGLAA